MAYRGDRGGITTKRPVVRVDRVGLETSRVGYGDVVRIGGALVMTRSGNTHMPCEPFRLGHVRVAGSKVPKMVMYSGDGNSSAR